MAIHVLLVIMLICGVSQAEVYKVGGSNGWTNSGGPQYKSWSASKTFHVDDVIVFEYNKEYHNVLRVTHKNFNACNATSPHSTWTSGNDSFHITRPGHFYFICGFPDHCQSGQKVDIRVPRHSPNGPTPSPSPISPSSQSPRPISFGPSPSPAVAPAPHKNGGSSLYSSWKVWSSALMIIALKGIAY